jgi:hypothetical protein
MDLILGGLMQFLRKPTEHELRLIEVLVEKSSLKLSDSWKGSLLVCDIDDGGMGSLELFPNGHMTNDRTPAKLLSEVQFSDMDGVEVLASLFSDRYGDLFELDVWKTDFGSLIKIPYL